MSSKHKQGSPTSMGQSPAKEIRRYPTRRCQEVVEYEDGSRKRICYSNNCPHFYQDEKGELQPIDLAIREKHSAKVGKHHLRDRNVVSVGFRDDGEHGKFLGFRPDANQAQGTEQLEFSLDSITFDGKKQPTDLSRNDKLDDLTTRLGSILVRSTRQRTRQLIRVDRPIGSFEISFTLHVKGLTIEERDDEFWFFGETDGEFRFRLRRPCLCGLDFETLDVASELVEHSLTYNGDGTFAYVKRSTPAFASADLPPEYYIDADVYYSSTADGFVARIGFYNWESLHDAATGSGSLSDNATNGNVHKVDTYNVIKSLTRSFFFFDTSGATSPTAASVFLYGRGSGTEDTCAQKGTQADTLSFDDYDSFSGSEYGYCDEWTLGIHNEIPFDATGISELNLSGTTKIAVRDRNADYLDTDLGTNTSNQIYFSDNTGTDKDPYLEITEGGPTANPMYYYQHTMLGV